MAFAAASPPPLQSPALSAPPPCIAFHKPSAKGERQVFPVHTNSIIVHSGKKEFAV
jgi:hypothetical protein